MSVNWYDLNRKVDAILRRLESPPGELIELRDEVKRLSSEQVNLNDRIEEMGRNFDAKVNEVKESIATSLENVSQAIIKSNDGINGKFKEIKEEMKFLPSKVCSTVEMGSLFEMADVFEGYCDLLSTDHDKISLTIQKITERIEVIGGELSSTSAKIAEIAILTRENGEALQNLTTKQTEMTFGPSDLQNSSKDINSELGAAESYIQVLETAEVGRENETANLDIIPNGDALSSTAEDHSETIHNAKEVRSYLYYESEVVNKAPDPKEGHKWMGIRGCPHWLDVPEDLKEGESIECAICGNKGAIYGPGLRRLRKEYDNIKKCGMKAIDRVEIDRDHNRHWNIILHPEKEPYAKGAFRVSISFSEDYPFERPLITFLTRIYHPNFNEKGYLWLHIFCCGDGWKPVTRIHDLMKQLLELLYDPELDKAYNVEMAQQFTIDRKKFNEAAEEFTKKYAEKRQ